MKGYIKVAAVMPTVKVGNSKANIDSIKEDILKCNALGIKLAVFPELCITSCNLKKLYLDTNLLKQALNSLFELIVYSTEFDILIVVSLPFKLNNIVYEVAAIIKSGKLLALVPNNSINNKNLNYGYFSNYNGEEQIINLYDEFHNIDYNVVFSNSIVISNKLFDLSVIFNLHMNSKYKTSIYANISSLPETIDIEDKLKSINLFSSITNSCVVTSCPGPSESSTNYSYFGRSTITEDGDTIAKNDILNNHILYSDIDLDKISLNTFENDSKVTIINFEYSNYIENNIGEKLKRDFNKLPYINIKANPFTYSMHIINILAVALAKRFTAIKAKNYVIGVSGGLDSTIALIIAKKAAELSSISSNNILAYSMPCFGTTSNSTKNMTNLLKALEIKLNTIDIKNTVMSHFKDIGHDINNTNVTFENAQARERTQVLMDIANDVNGLVIGTGDLSEIALGFSTYNGDHMSMYNVNGSLPKSFIKYILNSIADENIKRKDNILLADTLKNIIHSPISPELMPTENDLLIQKTEEILGNYEIHDFVIYNYLKYNYELEKILDLTLRTFVYNNTDSKYSEDYIKTCVNMFFNRFFKSQYKRSTSPDFPDIGLPTLGKTNKFDMPNDLELKYEI